MTSEMSEESLPASLVAIIVYVPSKALFKPERVRFSRSSLNTPARLVEKLVIILSVGMLKVFPFKSVKVQRMLSVCTSGEASKMTKDTVTLISWIPAILSRTASTVGGTEGRRGGTQRVMTAAQGNVVRWCEMGNVMLLIRCTCGMHGDKDTRGCNACYSMNVLCTTHH